MEDDFKPFENGLISNAGVKNDIAKKAETLRKGWKRVVDIFHAGYAASVNA